MYIIVISAHVRRINNKANDEIIIIHVLIPRRLMPSFMRRHDGILLYVPSPRLGIDSNIIIILYGTAVAAAAAAKQFAASILDNNNVYSYRARKIHVVTNFLRTVRYARDRHRCTSCNISEKFSPVIFTVVRFWCTLHLANCTCTNHENNMYYMLCIPRAVLARCSFYGIGKTRTIFYVPKVLVLDWNETEKVVMVKHGETHAIILFTH